MVDSVGWQGIWNVDGFEEGELVYAPSEIRGVLVEVGVRTVWWSVYYEYQTYNKPQPYYTIPNNRPQPKTTITNHPQPITTN